MSIPASTGRLKADPARPYKAIAAAVIAVAITVVQAIQSQSADGQWTTEDTIVTILAFLGAVAVYLTSNPIVADSVDGN